MKLYSVSVANSLSKVAFLRLSHIYFRSDSELVKIRAMLKLDENLITKSQKISISALEFENKLVFMYTKDENKILTK